MVGTAVGVHIGLTPIRTTIDRSKVPPDARGVASFDGLKLRTRVQRRLAVRFDLAGLAAHSVFTERLPTAPWNLVIDADVKQARKVLRVKQMPFREPKPGSPRKYCGEDELRREYRNVRRWIVSNRGIVESFARKLYRKKTIHGPEIEKHFAKLPRAKNLGLEG